MARLIELSDEEIEQLRQQGLVLGDRERFLSPSLVSDRDPTTEDLGPVAIEVAAVVVGVVAGEVVAKIVDKKLAVARADLPIEGALPGAADDIPSLSSRSPGVESQAEE